MEKGDTHLFLTQYHGEALPLSLDTITWFDRIRWSAQAIVAPEELDDMLAELS